MFNVIIIVILAVFLWAAVVAIRGLEKRLSRIEQIVAESSQRYCVHSTFTADGAPWSVYILPEGIEPVLTPELPKVMVSSAMTFHDAHQFAQEVNDHVAMGQSDLDHPKGHA